MEKSKQTDIIEINSAIAERLSVKFSEKHKLQISPSDIFSALFMLWGGDMFWLLELMDSPIHEEKAEEALEKFDFEQFYEEIVLPQELFDDIKLYERKALVKSAGSIWKIHLYDQDPFPSLPHAHNLEENIKLDLSNGKCYRKREYLKTLSKKHLLMIREKAAQRFKGNLPDLSI
jgi:hypothetical protein